ncbi:MAG: endonuclease III [Clostridiales bacterium]|nr:endonuclease III [Clostridiales bacterium]
MTKPKTYTTKQKAIEVCNRLEEYYPDASCSLTYSKPHELMIAGRLSAQCTDARVNIVSKPLFEKYTSIKDFAEAEISDIEEIIKPCGLYKTKAKSIKEMCQQLIENFNGEIPNTLEELTTLSGIGRKTANLIMGDVHHMPAIVTDTHFIRITGRIGLTKNKIPKKVEDDLRKIIPPEKSSDFCHRIVIFGRDICKARGERCEKCPISDICDYNKSRK